MKTGWPVICLVATILLLTTAGCNAPVRESVPIASVLPLSQSSEPTTVNTPSQPTTAAVTEPTAADTTKPSQQPKPTVPPGSYCLEIEVSLHDAGHIVLEKKDSPVTVYPRHVVGTEFEVFTAGTVVTLTATPRITYEFERWGGDAVGMETTTITLTVNSDMSVTAVFRCN